MLLRTSIDQIRSPYSVRTRASRASKSGGVGSGEWGIPPRFCTIHLAELLQMYEVRDLDRWTVCIVRLYVCTNVCVCVYVFMLFK